EREVRLQKRGDQKCAACSQPLPPPAAGGSAEQGEEEEPSLTACVEAISRAISERELLRASENKEDAPCSSDVNSAACALRSCEELPKPASRPPVREAIPPSVPRPPDVDPPPRESSDERSRRHDQMQWLAAREV
ncbi:MAG: hypothetical protein SGPRY_014736, partial [Prymnesium sp.]